MPKVEQCNILQRCHNNSQSTDAMDKMMVYGKLSVKF